MAWRLSLRDEIPPCGKSRGGTPEGVRALQSARRTERCGGCYSASFRRSASFFDFVARVSEAKPGDRQRSWTIVPGLRCAPSGLRAERDRDGSRKNHRRGRLTKIGF